MKGWFTRTDTRYLEQTLPELKRIFRPKEEIMQKAEKWIAECRESSDIMIDVYIHRGDYATWNDGSFFYPWEEYHAFMFRVQELYKNKRVSFFISSNEDFSLDIFKDCHCRRLRKEPSGVILNLYTITLCNRIIGPFSSYSRWHRSSVKFLSAFLRQKSSSSQKRVSPGLLIISTLKTEKKS